MCKFCQKSLYINRWILTKHSELHNINLERKSELLDELQCDQFEEPDIECNVEEEMEIYSNDDDVNNGSGSSVESLDEQIKSNHHNSPG